LLVKKYFASIFHRKAGLVMRFEDGGALAAAFLGNQHHLFSLEIKHLHQ